MSNKIEAKNAALGALEDLQDFTKAEFPIGTKVKSKRGRGEASFTVTGYPEATSLELANSVLGLSKNGKTQTLNLDSVSLDTDPVVAE
jgi:hypothetical protein